MLLLSSSESFFTGNRELKEVSGAVRTFCVTPDIREELVTLHTASVIHFQVCTILLVLLVLVLLFECNVVNNEGSKEGKNTEVACFF